MSEEKMDLVYFRVSHPDDMPIGTIIANVKKAITNQGYDVGDVEEMERVQDDRDGDTIIGITLQVSYALSSKLEEEEVMSFTEDGVDVEAEWP